MGFFDIHTSAPLQIGQISEHELLFRVWVMKYALGKNGWKIIGQLPLTEEMKEEPWFFKRDAISGKLTRYKYPDEIPATKHECKGLECAAVWDPCHIESRLSDHFAGRPNKWVESLSLK